LIEKLKNNEKDAFAFVFRSYYRELYYLAFKIIHNAEDARDITQTTFIKFWESRQKLIDGMPLKPFLFIIQRNNCLDFIKSRRNKFSPIPADSIPDQKIESSFDEIIAKELEFKIVEAVSELPLKCRQIFELSRYAGLKYSEIASKLNISVKTVENQMSIALDKLRNSLADYLPIIFFFFCKIF
jgi:RNA polymerase sigma-70 factor (ECF subfamily)